MCGDDLLVFTPGPGGHPGSPGGPGWCGSERSEASCQQPGLGIDDTTNNTFLTSCIFKYTYFKTDVEGSKVELNI